MDNLNPQEHGLRDWLLQRVTAVYLGCYVIYLVVHFVRQPSHSYEQWQAWISHPLMAIVSAGFILATLLHAWVGMRDVVLDYIHPVGLRLILLFLMGLLLIGCGFWALRFLLLATV